MMKFIERLHLKLMALMMSVGFIVICFPTVAHAQNLSQPESFYNSISWTWFYSDKATPSYNCLGYATGSMTWEWPSSWGDGATKIAARLLFS